MWFWEEVALCLINRLRGTGRRVMMKWRREGLRWSFATLGTGMLFSDAHRLWVALVVLDELALCVVARWDPGPLFNVDTKI